ncbi:MAG: hypothetical protein H0X18_06830 [Geodermatophilaceae bacterium]|nr:hypothetical protein [Geodermatophilaceae bacterium]
MTSYARKSLVTLFAGAAVFAGAGAASAAGPQIQDGLINVAVGDVTITDAVDVGVAAQIAANICGVKVGPVAVLGRSVDRSGESRTVCTTDQGPVTLTNN